MAIELGGVIIDQSKDSAPTNFPYLNAAVIDDFLAVLEEIQNAGGIRGTPMGRLGVNELFRTFETQVEYYKQYKANIAAQNAGKPKPYPRIAKAAKVTEDDCPGTSNHGAGFSVDTSDYAKKVRNGRSVEQVFNKHGFYRNEPNDPPHFNYKTKPTHQQKLDAQDYYRNCLK
ncbi:MAG: D-alanyl-D-alanine carboxypeptidase family protein [Pyrinomonadaceae bacterium]|nr:D-alanyl-D-alanine carboxypeptidase family protein [Pyrinomonadaceae bacterium]